MIPKWLARWILRQPWAKYHLDKQGLEYRKGWDRPRLKEQQ